MTQVSWPDESEHRPGMVVEVPAAAFGEAFAADHAGETFTGTLLDVHCVEEDGAILWNVRHGDGDCGRTRRSSTKKTSPQPSSTKKTTGDPSPKPRPS